MPKYTHPTVRNGQVTHDGAEYPIVDGTFEAPAHVAAQIHGVRAHVEIDPDAPIAPVADAPVEESLAAPSKGRRLRR